MTDREKLVGLIVEIENELIKAYPYTTEQFRIEKTADYLLANGVTVKQPTNIAGKCGSCVHAHHNTSYFGGAKSYIVCKNPEKRFRRKFSHVKQRSCPACKLYAPKEE